MRSSYALNRYDKVFRSLVEGFKPILSVELGVLDGYSLLAIADGLKKNFENGHGKGNVEAYDLFEDYPFKHGTREGVEALIAEFGLKDFVKIEQADAFTVHERYPANTVNFLHVDISNTGETVHKIMEQWDSKMQTGGLIVFEGGTVERDKIEWMAKYGKPPIKKAVEDDPILSSKYVYSTYLKFPGLTTCLKKR